MSKVKHIIAREYITRVRKKAFILMTLLGPLLFAGMFVVPIWLTTLEDQDEKTIAVVEYDKFGNSVPDSLMFFKGVIANKSLLKFEYIGGISEAQAEALAMESNYYGFLKIKHNVIFSGDDVSVELLAKKQPSMGIEMHITNSLEEYLKNKKLLTYNVPVEVVKNLKTRVNLSTKRLDKNGGFKDQGDQNVKRAVGYISSLLIYMFIFYFGAQVMRGVVEEKTNRIIEVVITSVKPFQLMLGKIVGIGLVGLTQFLAWSILTMAIYTFASSFLLSEQLKTLQAEQAPTELFESSNTPIAPEQVVEPEINVSGILDTVNDINIPLTLALFLFYFLAGYLLYASMFAAIGSAVDSETDTQQFMFPVTIPLIVAIIVMSNAISNPSGQVAFWFSMIPFTSPIIMMARIPFGVPIEQVLISMAILVATFILFTWLSGKIYRTGILMYGKKVSFKEIAKWMRYK
jgi:ABC-2 type transport system permease protein